jgi:hypothetical protein
MKNTAFRKCLALVNSLNNEADISIEDWDNMLAIKIKNTFNNEGVWFVFYEDGTFRSIMEISKIDE